MVWAQALMKVRKHTAVADGCKRLPTMMMSPEEGML